MRVQPPDHLHWVQVRDAVAEPGDWQRGRIVDVTGIVVTVESDTGRRTVFNCKRLDRFPELLDDTVAHEAGGSLAIWTLVGRVIAIPIASDCIDDAPIHIDNRVVVVQEGRNFELVAEDARWRMRLFDARVRIERPEPVATAAAPTAPKPPRPRGPVMRSAPIYTAKRPARFPR